HHLRADGEDGVLVHGRRRPDLRVIEEVVHHRMGSQHRKQSRVHRWFALSLHTGRLLRNDSSASDVRRARGGEFLMPSTKDSAAAAMAVTPMTMKADESPPARSPMNVITRPLRN